MVYAIKNNFLTLQEKLKKLKWVYKESGTDSLGFLDSYFPVTYKTKILDTIFSAASVVCMIVSVYWFNPFGWLFLKCFLADLELACDERVVTGLGAERAKEYALSLLESKQGTTVFASAFGGAKIRTRVEHIVSFKKMTWLNKNGYSLSNPQ